MAKKKTTAKKQTPAVFTLRVTKKGILYSLAALGLGLLVGWFIWGGPDPILPYINQTESEWLAARAEKDLPPGISECGVDNDPQLSFDQEAWQRMSGMLGGRSGIELALEPRVVRVGVVVDSRFIPSESVEQITTRVHEGWAPVTTLYSEDVGYELDVSIEQIFRDEDPWEDVPTKPGTSRSWDYTVLLTAFREWAHLPDSPLMKDEVDCMIFITGRYPSVAGAAYATSICSSQKWACALSFGTNKYVLAHELAHMLGVGHDTKDDIVNRYSFIMAKSVGYLQNFKFSERSLSHFAQQRYIFTCLPAPVPPGDAPFIRGDVTRDSKVNMQDGIALLNYLFPPPGQPRYEPTCMDACDVNDTGTVGLDDAMYLFNYLYRGDDYPPPKTPFPQAGSDPTLDLMGCVE